MTMPVSPAELDDDPPGVVPAVLALGSNLGDRAELLQSAVDALAGFEGIRVASASPVVESAAVGGPDQPPFLNAVLLVETTLSPLSLLAVCQQVEVEHGRRRIVRWGPRTLDIDVIAYSDLVAESEDLTLPHPRAAERPFVLAPWAAVDPSASIIVKGSPVPVADLLRSLPDIGLSWPGIELRVAA